MRPHNINSTDSFIQGWYIDNAICNDLLDYYNNPAIEKYVGLMGPNGPTPQSKESLDVSVLPNSIEIQPYSKELKKCLDLYYDKFYHSGGSRGYSMKENVNIQHYGIGGGFKIWHCERASADNIIRDRHLVFMTYLNDVDDGGTEFLYQNLIIKAEKGLTLIWPADWTHTHKGQISYTKEKTIITGWLSYN
jgi:prolyl 4-hydroxylase